MVWKSIKVSEDTYNDIESLKIHRRQPAQEVIDKGLSLLKAFKTIKREYLSQLIDEDETLPSETKARLRELFDSI